MEYLIAVIDLIKASDIKTFAREAGFSLCGIARVRGLKEQAGNLDGWLRSGYDSGLAYMGRNTEKRLDPALLFGGAKSVIVCAVNYKNACSGRQDDRNPKIASYALCRDYHFTIKERLKQVLGRISEKNPGIRGRCFTDSAPVLEKSWAVEAGLGWRGRNSLVITPGYGSFVLLGEIIIDAETDVYDEPFVRDGCGSCTACVDACPNSAICPPYVIDTNRCISRLTTEKLPDGCEPTADTHGWIFGCDVCQNVCPHNTRTPLSSDPAFAPLINPYDVEEHFWKDLDKEGFDDIFGDTPLARTGFETIKEGNVIL